MSSMKRSVYHLSLIALCSFMAICSPIDATATQAATPNYGYLWELVFDFENGLNGVLKIEVGPWQDGNLVWVEATSETTIECEPSGRVFAMNGVATFAGNGYLECEMNIAKIVLEKHNLITQETDVYGSLIMQTEATLDSADPAPIFNHPDALFRLEPIGSLDIRMVNDLSNEHDPIAASFFGVNWNTVQTYTSDYVCIPDLQCDLEHSVSAKQVMLTKQGEPVTFTTGPTAFTIGKDDTGYLNGRVDSILIDPGNFVHQNPEFALYLPLAVR